MTLQWPEPPRPRPHPSGGWVCPCGQVFTTEVGADACEHRRDRIDHERPVVWWSAGDEAILRGEIAKLQGLPRPAYVERDADRLVYRQMHLGPSRRDRVTREVGAWVVLMGVLGIMALIIWAASEPPDDPGPVVTPTTYAPAAPTLAAPVWVGP